VGLHETETEVMAEGAVTVIVVDPDLVESCVEVAVMVTEPALLGAVKSPEELIVPLLALHVTVEL